MNSTKNPTILYLLGLLMMLLQGCSMVGYVDFYQPVAPVDYSPSGEVTVFQYENVNISEIYDLLYSDYVVVGESTFHGAFEDPESMTSFAESIGADVFITSAQKLKNRVLFSYSLPVAADPNDVSGYTGLGSIYENASKYGVSTKEVPTRDSRFDQSGMYLRNVNHVVPIWDRREAQYRKTGQHEMDGLWENADYQLLIYQSGEQMVAFLSKTPEDIDDWSTGQLKMMYGISTGVGIYLMKNKAPEPARFGVNKFGHLVVDLFTRNESFSFVKKN